MPLPSKSYMARQASRKEAMHPTASPDSPTVAAGALEGTEKTRSTAVPTVLSATNHLKDTRAYEHERQRLRKAADFVKMRARKARQGNGLGSNKPGLDHTESKKGSGVGPLSEKRGRLGGEDKEGDEVEGPVPPEDYPKVVDLAVDVDHQPRYEVKLADLVRTGRLRKPKGDADFEVIPHIRSVIVLDDNTPNELDLDGPWEHIGSIEGEDAKGLSYAQIVVLSK